MRHRRSRRRRPHRMFGPAANPNEVADPAFGLTYYPGASDASRAVGIDLQPGSRDCVAIDFTLIRTQRVRMSGQSRRHVDRTPASERGSFRQPARCDIRVVTLDGSYWNGSESGNRYNPATGEFVLPNVATGSYWLQVISQGATAPPRPGVQHRHRRKRCRVEFIELRAPLGRRSRLGYR